MKGLSFVLAMLIVMSIVGINLNVKAQEATGLKEGSIVQPREEIFTIGGIIVGAILCLVFDLFLVGISGVITLISASLTLGTSIPVFIVTTVLFALFALVAGAFIGGVVGFIIDVILWLLILSPFILLILLILLIIGILGAPILILTLPIWFIPFLIFSIGIILFLGVLGAIITLVLSFILELLGIPAFSVIMLVFQILGQGISIPLILIRGLVSSCAQFIRGFGETETSEVIT